MSKQKVFWGPMNNPKIRHLWRLGDWSYKSSCGLWKNTGKASRKGDKCKRCLKAIES